MWKLASVTEAVGVAACAMGAFSPPSTPAALIPAKASVILPTERWRDLRRRWFAMVRSPVIGDRFMNGSRLTSDSGINAGHAS